MRHSTADPATHVLLRERQPRARRDLDLQAHQVEPGHQFRDRVLHLEAGVHLQEVEPAILVHQEFDRAGIVIAAARAARTAACPSRRASRGARATSGDGHSSITF